MLSLKKKIMHYIGDDPDNIPGFDPITNDNCSKYDHVGISPVCVAGNSCTLLEHFNFSACYGTSKSVDAKGLYQMSRRNK